MASEVVTHDMDDLGGFRGMFKGSLRFLLRIAVFFLICIVIPVAILHPAAQARAEYKERVVYYIAMVALWTLAALYVLWSLRFLLTAPCFKPPVPVQSGPFSEAEISQKRVSVRRIYVIVNPHGGNKRGLRVLNVIQPLLEEQNVTVTVLQTEYAGHARVYANTVSFHGYDALCVIGGDGSLHETVNGMLTREDRQQLPIGLIPAGTGNSFALDLGTWDPTVATQRILDGTTVAVDANKVTDEGTLDVFSINTVCWGLLGDLAISSEACRWLGGARYNVAAVWEVLKKAFHPGRLTYDAVVKEAKFVTAFANQTQYFGKGTRGAPLAKLDDGKMDLVMATEAPRGHLLRLFAWIHDGSHIESVIYAQVADLELRPSDPSRPAMLNIDGEPVRARGVVRVRCHKHAFRIFAPVDCPGPVPFPTSINL